ncbi:histidine phosphatase family protein, partial [Paenibacillus sp. TAF43_2]|uniref:histidine phosphatase family protein n=1 Tax=Paenibacillus sp. TAF43_2 TaxID=3233069 RepID=UPI003F9AA73D
NRALAVISDVRNSGFSNVVIVTHGNLMSLLLKHYDTKFGFEEWASLSNPDVYHLQFEGEVPIIQRIWNG